MMLARRIGNTGTLDRLADLTMDRSPFAMIDEVRREMDRMFDQVFAPWSAPRATTRDGGATSAMMTWTPSMDVEETRDEVRLHVEVPGIPTENLHVDVTGDLLTIIGERTDEHRETDGVYRLTERRSGRFERRLTLPDYVDADAISATYENGVLTVTLPKRPELSRQRRVEIRNANQPSLLGRGSDRNAGGDNGSTERGRATAGAGNEAATANA